MYARTRTRARPRGSWIVRARYMFTFLLILNCSPLLRIGDQLDAMTNEIPWYDWKAGRWRSGIDPESESVS